eukprot:4559333-Alexandrium_andersonii.AAC.1
MPRTQAPASCWPLSAPALARPWASFLRALAGMPAPAEGFKAHGAGGGKMNLAPYLAATRPAMPNS